jgi:hypothetical protein
MAKQQRPTPEELEAKRKEREARKKALEVEAHAMATGAIANTQLKALEDLQRRIAEAKTIEEVRSILAEEIEKRRQAARAASSHEL